MKTIILQNGKTVSGGYIAEIPDDILANGDYVIAFLGKDEESAAVSLLSKGFRFVDRSISTVLRIAEPQFPTRCGNKFKFVVSKEIDQEAIYRIALGHFDKDCRFALDQAGIAPDLKDELLYRYIGDLKERGLVASYCLREGILAGFNLWTVEGDGGRIYLGAISKRYQHTGIALYLYAYTIQQMKEAGASLLRDRISTANAASLNLHMMLARFLGGGRELNLRVMRIVIARIKAI